MAETNRSSLKEFIASIATIKGDLSNITAPPFLLASQSTAEFPSYWAERPGLFSAPATEPDPKKRILLVLKWFLASLKRQQYAGRDEKEGVKKPLNAFLGELFLGVWRDGDGGADGIGGQEVRLISEQVSHHPPITACYLCNEKQGIRAEGYACQNITFTGSVNIKQIGHAIIHIEKFDEDFLIPLPQVRVQGLLTGTPYPELTGTYDIVSSSGYIAEVDFSGKKLFGLTGKKNQIHAGVFAADDSKRKNPIYTVEGTWNDTFTIKDEESGKVIEEYDTNATPPTPVLLPSIQKQDPWESHRAWGGTIDALNHGQMQAVSDAKSKVEEGQREMRRQEEAKGLKWEPVFFVKASQDEKYSRLAAMSATSGDEDGQFGFWKFSPGRAQKARRPYHGDLVPELSK